MFALIFVLLILFPIAELYVIIQVGDAIGVLPTLALLVVDGIVGAAIARSQGRAVVARFQQAMSEGRVPAREAFDGAMIAIGGALLLAPGFITDVFGLALLLPPTRAVIRTLVGGWAKRRPTSVLFRSVGSQRGPGTQARDSRRPPPGADRDPFAGRRPRPTYDYEGTARDVTEPPEALGEGSAHEPRERSDG